MAQTVGAVIDRAKRILQERGDGIRWTVEELVGWLNEAYIIVATQRPDAHSITADISLQAGARQQIPDDGLRLMDILANEKGRAIRATDRRMLDTTLPNWAGEKASLDTEFFVFDERTPRDFWVYPPAPEGAQVSAVYVEQPSPHAVGDMASPLSVSDRYAPALLDLVLYRAFSKDAESQANLGRAQMHYKSAMEGVGIKTQSDTAMSPNGGGQDAG
ncbi:phage adaptor protein [Halomonas sp. hl-4]|uniref:phage adaptor protein n=1 Tax=Halomonas sp. hl-4 TaxID=1761789 RepID=UPI000BB84FF3|nr:DUF6682 family protein [Halomonas sp. hl-4]SNY95568.1 hypothetical protein SAMN04488142_0069 [Halomonas sp. hl-4]